MIKKTAPEINNPTTQSSSSNLINTVVTLFLSLYLFIDCTPAIEIQDQMGLHWLLLATLNLVAGAYIFSSKTFLERTIVKPLFKNSIVILYLVFFVVTGLSLFVTINPIEGLVIYSRLTTVCLTFIIFCILLRKRMQVLQYIAPVIMLIVLGQSFSAIMQFYSGAGKVDLSTLIMSLQSTTGNKNICCGTCHQNSFHYLLHL